jgi:hypothetical protein
MTAGRFQMPAPDASTPVRFPPVVSDTLDNGLTVRLIPQQTVPVVTLALVLQRGTSDDPPDRHGLASLTGDLLDEGAGSRDAIEVAEAFGRLGAELDLDVGPDATTLAVTTLVRHLDAVLDLVGDIVMRPRLEEPVVRCRRRSGDCVGGVWRSPLRARLARDHGGAGWTDRRRCARVLGLDVYACGVSLHRGGRGRGR